MTPDDEDDSALLRAWRDAPQDAPGDLIDRRVLRAAEEQHRRRRGVPLAAALAACLVLAIYSLREPLVTAPAAVPPQLDTSSFGLYEGRTVDIGMAPAAAPQLAMGNGDAP